MKRPSVLLLLVFFFTLLDSAFSLESADLKTGLLSSSSSSIKRLLLEDDNAQAAVDELFRLPSSDRLHSLIVLSNDVPKGLFKNFLSPKKLYAIKKFYDLVGSKAIKLHNQETSYALQLIAIHSKTIFHWILSNIFSPPSFPLVTIDPSKMLYARDIKRVNSYLDAASFPIECAKEEGSLGVYWRGAEGITKLGKGVLKGFIQTTSTGDGHFQDRIRRWNNETKRQEETPYVALDIKQITEGEGIQVIEYLDNAGNPFRVEMVYLKAKGGTNLAFVPPGAIDYVINVKNLRFQDVTVGLRQEEVHTLFRTRGFDEPKRDCAVSLKKQPLPPAPYVVVQTTSGLRLAKTSTHVPPIIWLKGGRGDLKHFYQKIQSEGALENEIQRLLLNPKSELLESFREDQPPVTKEGAPFLSVLSNEVQEALYQLMEVQREVQEERNTLMYAMVHGILPTQGLTQKVPSGRISTFHETVFLHDRLPGTTFPNTLARYLGGDHTLDVRRTSLPIDREGLHRLSQVLENALSAPDADLFLQEVEWTKEQALQALVFLRDREQEIGYSIEIWKKDPYPIILKGSVQSYEWGGNECILTLLRKENPEKKPYAELWIGAHPLSPSVSSSFALPISLKDILLDACTEIVGDETASCFHGTLPYLFKLLDAKKMLSIQAHPNQKQAREGFQKENELGISILSSQRNYKDDNHKPEVHCALSDFWMLHGFRPILEIFHTLKTIPEFQSITEKFCQDEHDLSTEEKSSIWLQNLYRYIMSLSQAHIDDMINPLIDRLTPDYERYERGERFLKDGKDFKDTPEFWTVRAARFFPLSNGHRDRGIFSLYLLNLIHLKPGQGTYQPAGVLHAYLEGTTMELMANSDNVLRGGLTPKHVDVTELLQTVLFEGGIPEILFGKKISSNERVYHTDAKEFELSRIDLTKETPYRSLPGHNADSLLVLGTPHEDGSVNMASDVSLTVSTGDRCVHLGIGEILFVPYDVSYSIESKESVVLFRATVPLP